MTATLVAKDVAGGYAHRVLFENVDPRDAVLALLAREPRAE